jgi:hypothetical protein
MNIKHTTLRDRISYGPDLTQKERESFAAMISKGCRANNRDRIARRVMLPLSIWGNYGIYDRVWFGEYNPEECSYCCGQSYTDEMRTLRECILGM